MHYKPRSIVSCYRGWPYIEREKELSVVTALSRADFCREGNELNPTHTTSTNTFSPATHAQPPPLPLVYYIHSSVFSLSLSGRCNVRGRHLHSPICRGVNALPLPFFSQRCVCILWMCVSCPDKIQLFVSSLFLFFLFCFVLFFVGLASLALYTRLCDEEMAWDEMERRINES